MEAVAATARAREDDVTFLTKKLAAVEQQLNIKKTMTALQAGASLPPTSIQSVKSALMLKAAEVECAASSRDAASAVAHSAVASDAAAVHQLLPLLQSSCERFNDLHSNICQVSVFSHCSSKGIGRHIKVLQRLADVDSEAGDARARAVVAAVTAMPQDVSAAMELQSQLQTLQERLHVAELARVKEMHAAAAEHSEQVRRLHHKLAATELQVPVPNEMGPESTSEPLIPGFTRRFLR